MVRCFLTDGRMRFASGSSLQRPDNRGGASSEITPRPRTLTHFAKLAPSGSGDFPCRMEEQAGNTGGHNQIRP